MADDYITEFLEVDEEVIELMATAIMGVEMSIGRAHAYKIAKTENVPYSHFISTFMFQLCCWLASKGVGAAQQKATFAALADVADIHMAAATHDSSDKIH
jgi:hypothetical protein